MLTCQCPAAASLTTIPAVICAESFGQIQKVAFQRLTNAAGVRNSFTSRNARASGTVKISDPDYAITAKASWTAKMTASDDTKIVVSPYIEAPTQEAGAPRTFGGGNETLGGIEVIVGREPNTFTAALRNMPQSVIKVLKELQCEAATGNLGVFLFDENGKIEAIKDEEMETTYYPIPVRSLFVGDKAHGGLEAPDSNSIQWSFLPNYSDNLAIVTPEDFNPLTDLVPAT